MKTRTLGYIISGLTVLLVAVAIPLLSSMVQSQDEDDDESSEVESAPSTSPSPSATIVNSKYLTLAGVTFNEEDNQVTIAGNISNISPDQTFINVVVAGELYDNQNMLITTSTGTAGLANLQPGQQSAFTMTTNIPSGDEVTRFTVLPGGSVG
jgi:hypothetical protein